MLPVFMYHDSDELEKCMEFFSGIVLALTLTIVLVVGTIILFVWFNWWLFGIFAFASFILIRIIKQIMRDDN